MIGRIVSDRDVRWGDDAVGSRRRTSRLRLSVVVFLLTVLLWPLLGCATPIRQPAVPKDREAAAVVDGMTGIRYWQQGDLPLLQEDARDSYFREADLYAAAGNK